MTQKSTNTMKSLLESERPYEKCERLGEKNLSDAELMAVLLRTGTKGENVLELCRRILAAGGGSLDALHGFTRERFQKIRGVGRVKSIQLICLVELSRRLAKETAGRGLNFSSPASVARYYMEDMRHLGQEHMKLLMLNTKSALLGEKDVYKGTVNASLVNPREIFVEALRTEAVSIILLHNHPSGDPAPSRADVATTERIRQAGELIGIELLDHIIIGNNCYISFREEGLLYTKG